MIQRSFIAFAIVCSLTACHHAPPPSIPSPTTAPIAQTQVRMVAGESFIPGRGQAALDAFVPDVQAEESGRRVRYSERRGIAHTGPTTGLTMLQVDSARRAAEAVVRSTTISFDYAIDQAMILNRGGGKPTVAVLATVRAAEEQKNLGKPRARLERMRKLCGV